MKHLFVFIAVATLTCGCRGVKQSYSITDPYSLPTIASLPQDYLTCTGILGEAPRNSLTAVERTKGLPYQLMAQSLQGLSFLAVAEGKSKTAI